MPIKISTPPMPSREQKLVDICFELVLTATSEQHSEYFRKLSVEAKARWVADQLKGCGFNTTPCGASWGVL